MSTPPLRRYAETLVRLDPSPPRRLVAAKAATAMGGPLVVGQLTGRLSLGLAAGLGAFAILYGPTTPGRFRARLLALVGLALVGSVALGTLTVGSPVLTLVLLCLVAVLAAFVCVSLKVGPPGSYFFVLVLGVANLAQSSGRPPLVAVGAAAAGALGSWLVGMSDLLVAPRAAEDRAVAAADRAVTTYAEAVGDERAQARAQASSALHRGWTAAGDGASPAHRALMGEVQSRYAAAVARDAAARVRAHLEEPHPWGSVDDATAEEEHVLGLDGAGGPDDRSLLADEGSTDEVDAEQLRDSSLGRPGAGYLLRQAASWPSEVLLVAARVGMATVVAGSLALLTHRGHAYWAVAFAALLLHQGGTREAQTVRALHRGLGTLVGLGAYLLLVRLAPQGWALVGVLVLLMLAVELLITRNYALAVVVITPLALTIGQAAAPGAPVVDTLVDRLTDTVIGIGCALAALWFTGRTGPELVLRGHARRVVVAVDRVLADLAAGGLERPEAVDHRRHLYFELLECDQVASRALSDAPAAVAAYRQMERSVSRLGYLVLGACWHPELRTAGASVDEARVSLRRVLAEPVTRPRAAADIKRDVQAVEAAVARLR